MDIRVRWATPHDVDVLLEHLLGVARESEGYEPAVEAARQATAAAILDPAKARYFVAEVDGRIAGSLFVTFEWSDWRNGWAWWIQGVYVRPPHRGAGVYTALYHAVRAAANESADVTKIRLYVHKDNPARAAYEAHGMAETPYRVYESDP